MTSTPIQRWFGILMLLAGIIGSTAVWSQTRSLPDAPGTWKPWRPLSATTGTGKDQAATPALIKAFEAELLGLQSIVKRAPGVASPVGFSVETWGFLASYHKAELAPTQPAAGRLPIAGGFTFGAFPIFEYQRNGKTIREDTGETALQQFLINQIEGKLFDRVAVPDWGSLDTDAFQKPMPQGEVAGLPRYGDGLIIARDPAALWTPLSLRDALDLVAKTRQLVVEGFEESLAAYSAQLAVVRDPANRAKRLKEAQEAAVLSKMPNPQAFVKQIEEAIGAEEASLLREIGPATGTGKSLADARRDLSEVTDTMAQLSPADLAAPSCYTEKGATLRSRFTTTTSAGCRPLVRPNYGYFNAGVPRSAPQVVIITGITRCFDTADKNNRDANSPSPAGCRANRALVETMDKSAIRAWLR